ncbi:MAG TPA: ROK family protein [Acidobacteriaceae bacterium]|nr:ROK family protein [Acidobacteriaceae bacterium]
MKTFSIGVDLGGTNLRVAAFTSDFRRIAQSAIPTRVAAGPEEVARDICREISKLLQECSSRGKLQGIGVGSPGPIELPAGRLGAPPNLPGFEGFELRKTLEGMLQLPVHVEHDTSAAALAECLNGAGREHHEDSLCMLTLGTGVGGGVLFGGKIWHGMNGMAGEMGHIPLFPDGEPCSCGGRGCLELYASATGIRRMAGELAGAGKAPQIAQVLDGDAALATFEIARLADGGDEQARALFSRVGRSLGIGLATLVNTLNLPLYVIGGGVANSWRLFAPDMMEALNHFSYVYRLTRPKGDDSNSRGTTRVVPAILGSDAGLLGAAMLPYS